MFVYWYGIKVQILSLSLVRETRPYVYMYIRILLYSLAHSVQVYGSHGHVCLLGLEAPHKEV